ncbi:DUF4280 domain-containing protein [Enterococcus sp. BWB1-3]|uniref:CdiA C-terminal domain-containing protein n=1 Tax=Enterococcus sp. BWB1-3 TaxID=2787713 RepID=UPI001924D5F9|nr:PAAR-like protein [Enterococcus sp. BWB1-3]MBL1229849.1 DUF4280 domain-containing protein [Enterococcus sp. BWB1-3]
MDLFSSLPGSKPLNQQKKSPSLTELLSGINLPASMGAEKEFVVENAPASCKFGTDISFIPASGGEVKIGSQLFLTKGNKKFEAPYFGTCLKQTADKKKEGKEEAVDCVPDCEPYEWTNLEEATTVSGEATLTVRSKLSCLHSGVPETINILDSGQGTDGKEMMEKLLEYDIYAKIVYDMDGNPKIFWSLEQDGRGVYNPEMSRYLKKVAPYLNFNIVNFISNDDWIEKINEATRNGYDYTTGKDYNWFVKWTGIASIYVLDGYEFFTQTELGIALMTLGFAYADYRLAYNQPKNFNGNKKASGAKGITPSSAKGGKPKGKYSPPNSRGLIRENETADLFASKGYKVEMLEEISGGNGYGIKPSSNPDYLIEDIVFDCYSPDKGTGIKGITKQIYDKTKKQTTNIVVNLDDYVGNIDDLKASLLSNTNNDLKYLTELYFVKNNEIFHIFRR